MRRNPAPTLDAGIQASQIRLDLIRFHQALGALHLQPRLNLLKRPGAFRSIVAFLADWAWIALSTVCVNKAGMVLVPLACLVIGSRQRALSNLIHDASHGNLFKSRRANDWATNCLAGYPLLETVRRYRESHHAHHHSLGDMGLDPDARSHLRYGYSGYDEAKATPGQTALGIYFHLLLNRAAWRDSVLGSVQSLTLQEKLQTTLFWIALVSVMALAFGKNGPGTSATFVILWWASRATTYHAIRILAEFLDHTGLRPGSIFGFTRNLPHGTLIAWFLHPHEDTYHLLHHLIPNLPHHALPKAHTLCVKEERYRNAHHCDSYIWGGHSAWLCWSGGCGRAAMAEVYE